MQSTTVAAPESTAILPNPKTEAESFPLRHLGSGENEMAEMLMSVGYPGLDFLVDAAVPSRIRLAAPLKLPAPLSENAALNELRELSKKNRVFRNFIGRGYHDCHTPAVIQRNILENPGWYTAYTPYQAEIAQGRLEALLNFQTMICDLTGLAIANASLLDEATAAAEAMHMALALKKDGSARTIVVSSDCHPQTIAVIQTRAEPLGVMVIVGDVLSYEPGSDVCAVVVQYPGTNGAIHDFTPLFEKAHKAGALCVVAADPLSLTLVRPPGEFGADIVIGSTQRFGVPLGFGGPHAAYLATKDEYKRIMPGRLVGVSVDSHGEPAMRLSLQTREQHIRRDKATSNICTAQVLLAVMASMYAVYHGPDGLRRIAQRVHLLARTFVSALKSMSKQKLEIGDEPFFDTVFIKIAKKDQDVILATAKACRLNLGETGDGFVVAFDETTTLEDVDNLLGVFSFGRTYDIDLKAVSAEATSDIPALHARKSPFLTQPVFNSYHTETEMLRYIRRLESKDLSLCHSMIPLGSCTMKLNATSEMFPVSWSEFSKMHPFAPTEQTAGYQAMADQLEKWLGAITGLPAVSLEPNAGSQGEYAGLLVIRKYHESRGDVHRSVCLIPNSAHGTNPASAVMAGMKVVPVKCDVSGNIDMADLADKVAQNADTLAALMITYPSTHGVFEETVRDICELIHSKGGQVYMDGANMNAQVGLTSPGQIGADVCHLNLHKTFCIPHGGGGPGMGPICVTSHLAPFLPSQERKGPDAKTGSISASAFSSASILPIPWMYIRMMGGEGLTNATKLAILNANYIAKRLESYYPVVFKGSSGLVAHECIIDLRAYKIVTAEDVAKRLMDYGFHAPTLSWPVTNTLMIEPTESESKAELDRFCDAMIRIHEEVMAVESGKLDKTDNPLKNAPHTARSLTTAEWKHPYTREQAGYPAPWLKEFKFWPAVGRVDSVFGDRHLVCTCLGMEAYGAENQG